MMSEGNVTADDLNSAARELVLPVVIFIGIIAVVGVIGNCCVIYVYTHKYPKCNFKYFVLFLAGIDLGSCVITMPNEIYTLLNWFIFPSSWYCKVKSACNVFTVCSSSSALLLIAIDRFRKVCRPHSQQIQPSLAWKLSIAVLVYALVPSASDAVFWGHHTYYTNYKGTQILVYTCEKDDTFKDTAWPKLHTVILYTGANGVIMLSTLVLYIFIAVKLFLVVPAVSMPSIRVSTIDSSVTMDNSTGANRDSVYTMGVDGLESGISESEDLDKPDQQVVRKSTGSLELVETDLCSKDVEKVVPEESVLLRKKVTKNRAVATKRVRLSTDIEAIEMRNSPRSRFSSEIISDELNIPETVIRPKSHRYSISGLRRLHRRRQYSIAESIGGKGARLKRKTLIMFILTAVFVVTTSLYLGMISHVADSSHFLSRLSVPERIAWLFFLRLYFINSVINPILYGFLDPRFKRALWTMGIRVSWIAGSLKKNLGQSIRRASSSSRKHENSVVNAELHKCRTNTVI